MSFDGTEICNINVTDDISNIICYNVHFTSLHKNNNINISGQLKRIHFYYFYIFCRCKLAGENCFYGDTFKLEATCPARPMCWAWEEMLYDPIQPYW